MSDERKRILDLVQDGKLSAEEAIILLEALGDQSVPKTDAKTTDNANTNHQRIDGDEPKKEQDRNDQQKSEGKSEDTFYSQLETAGERIFDFVNHAMKKIKDIDIQFGQAVDFPHVFQQENGILEKIDIDISNGPIKLIAWDQPDVRVECQAKVYRRDDREDARTYFLDNTIFTITDGTLHYGTQSKWMRVESTIYVPKKQYKKLSVRIFNGGFTTEGCHVDQLTIKTTNGKVDISRLEGNMLDIETVNGQINLKDARVDQIEAETVNGAIDLSGAFEGAKLQSFNGNISCSTNETGTGTIETKAVTGNIYISVPESATIDGDVRSNLGNYKLDLEGINVMHEKKEIIQKQVTFKRTGTDERVLHLFADTKTGSVQLKKAD